jgi:hypothetical protein
MAVECVRGERNSVGKSREEEREKFAGLSLKARH